jgi:hypothetical protein
MVGGGGNLKTGRNKKTKEQHVAKCDVGASLMGQFCCTIVEKDNKYEIYNLEYRDLKHHKEEKEQINTTRKCLGFIGANEPFLY